LFKKGKAKHLNQSWEVLEEQRAEEWQLLVLLIKASRKVQSDVS